MPVAKAEAVTAAMYSGASRRLGEAELRRRAQGHGDILLAAVADDRQRHLVARTRVEEHGLERVVRVDRLAIDLDDDVARLQTRRGGGRASLDGVDDHAAARAQV